jgi:hypothetical protein
MKDERRQPQYVVAVKVGEEYDLDVAWIDTQAMEVRQQRRATIQQHTAINHHGAVVTVERKRRAATEEAEL